MYLSNKNLDAKGLSNSDCGKDQTKSWVITFF